MIALRRFVQVVQWYLKILEPSAERDLGFIVDDGPGHGSLEVAEYLFTHWMSQFPGLPNLTHLLQWLDTVVFGPFKHHLKDEIKVFEKTRPVTVADVGKILAGRDGPANTPLRKAASEANLRSGLDQVR